ncbi:hypothetical protein B9Z55_001680 [Caenorhabditis nigoni]|uniref:Uncharacterized protein n=1 Tax=Caenorhabditis nigoni TaxID=1611254 RepID=A0A2G5VGS0_9PELO|nr:hypothetical protein B9Z55_001680 [Caenorhabditis nigoni]
MTRFQILIILLLAVPFVSCDRNPHLEEPVYKAVNATEIKYLVHKYQPTFAPCKYGAQFGFDQPFAVSDPHGNFSEPRKCCEKCEILHTTLTNGVEATFCCLPSTPVRHGKGAYTFGNWNGNDPLVILTNPLSIVFDRIVPPDLKEKDYRTWHNDGKPTRLGAGAYAYAFLGIATCQTVVLILVVVFYYVSHQRITLETIADCDYEIEQEVKVFNPSKSAMMSENMNSDLMSMSQAAV